MISLIVAYDRKFGIGNNNSMPWLLKEDLKIFKNITKEKYVVMGRKTFESIGQALPNRKNIIITRRKKYYNAGCEICHDPEKIKNKFESDKCKEIIIIGGAQIYKEFLGSANKLYITEVNTTKQSDAFFPIWDKSKFENTKRIHYKKNKGNEFDFTFTVWIKKS